MKNKKKTIIIIIVVLFILMLIPIPMKLKDGGSTEYKAILYKVTKIHRINEQSSTGYETGWEINVLGFQVYNKVNIEVKTINRDSDDNVEIYKDKSNKVDEKIIEINDIYDIYKTVEVKNYEDIRNLPQNYNKEQAQKDNCFVIGAMVHNDNLYNEFNEKYNKKENAFIRAAQSTVEGDTIITDIYYDANTNKIYLLKDNTRDEFSSKSDRIIKTNTFESISEWKHENNLYWIAYSGNINDLTLDSDNLYIITKIN